jgi:hypothetical protein
MRAVAERQTEEKSFGPRSIILASAFPYPGAFCGWLYPAGLSSCV